MLSRTTQPLTELSVLLVGSAAATRMAGMWLVSCGARVAHRGQPDATDDVVATYVAHGLAAFDPNDRFDAVVFSSDVERELDEVGPGIERADRIEITSPYSEGDDFRRSAISDMQLWARSGLGYLTRHMDATGEMTTIAIPRNRQASILGGALAALAVVTQQLSRRGDTGSKSHVRIDLLELLAMLPMQPVGFAQLDQRIVGAPSPSPFRMPGGTVGTSNGLAYVRPVEPAHWSKLLHLVGVRSDLADAVTDDLSLVRTHIDEIDERIRGWAASLTSEAVSDICQDEHIPVAPVYNPVQVASDNHLNARDFFTNGRVGLPWLACLDAPSKTERTARVAGVRPDDGLPLAGLRVLDLSWAWAGPYATTLLSDLGAEVINVEWHPRASNLRRNPPFAGGQHASNNTAAWWSANQRGKFSVGINMKSDEGRQIVRELAAQADVVVENFAPGVVDRLGVGYDDLRDVNPKLVYVSLSAFGQVGPRSHYIGYGTQVYAASGAGYATSCDGETASQMFIPYPDPVSGLCGSLAMAAYIWKARTEECSARVDVSELETVALVALEPLLAGMDVNRDVSLPEYIVAESREGEPIALFALDADEWRTIFGVLTAAEESVDAKTDDETIDSIVRVIAGLDKDTVLSRLENRGLAAAWVRNSAQVLADDYLQQSGFWVQDQSPEIRNSQVDIAGSLWTVNHERTPIWRGSPRLFGDTGSVLTRILGYSASQVEALASVGAIALDTPEL